MPKQNLKKINKIRSSSKRSHRSILQKSKYELSGDAQVYSYLGARPRATPAVHTEQTISTEQTVLVIGAVVTSVSNPVFFAQSFQLADLDQYTSFSSVFDQYKFNSVEVWIEPQSTNNNYTNTGRFVSVIDYDDSTALTNIAQAQDYANALVSSGQSSQYRRFVPHVAVAEYAGTSPFTGFGNMVADWIDTSSSTVKHFGLKLAFEPVSTAITFDLTFRYHISFRSIR